jgi:LPS sulfotransferase NodH
MDANSRARLTMNSILQAIGQQSCSELDRQKIADLNWADCAVDFGYIIFITGRCGSTWLTHLIEDTGLCGAPHEFFTPDSLGYFNKSIQASSFTEYLETVVQRFSKGRRFGFQINCEKLRDFQELVDIKQLFPPERRVYFLMTRQDIFSQAYSFARAKKSGHWHSFEYENKAYSIGTPNPDLSLDDVSIWKEVLLLISQERQFEAFARENSLTCIPLNYEQMVTDRTMVALTVLTALGCDIARGASCLVDAVNKTKKLDAGNKYHELIPFFEKYRNVIITLIRDRTSITWDNLYGILTTEYQFSREQLTT